MSIFNFTATPYDAGVLLTWDVAKGDADNSTSSDICHVTIQYSTNGVPSLIPNTPPYVVRDLEQPQLSSNSFWHSHLINGTPYTYTGFVVYADTHLISKPSTVGPVTPTSGDTAPFQNGILSFSKLGTNTVLTGDKDSKAEIIVWLPESQEDQKPYIENMLQEVKPAHTRFSVVYEPYYVAYTTSTQFLSGSYSSDTYEVVEGCIKNKIATIDASFSGQTSIYKGDS